MVVPSPRQKTLDYINVEKGLSMHILILPLLSSVDVTASIFCSAFPSTDYNLELLAE